MILLIYRMKFLKEDTWYLGLKEDTWYLGIQSGTGIVGHFENIVICSSAVEILAAGPRLVKKNTVAAQTHRREMSLKSYLSHVRLQNFLYQGQLEASNLQSWSYHPSLPPFPPDKCIQQPGWETGAPLVQSKRMLRGSSAGQLLPCIPACLQEINWAKVKSCLQSKRKPEVKQWLIWGFESELTGCGAVHIHTCKGTHLVCAHQVACICLHANAEPYTWSTCSLTLAVSAQWLLWSAG